jgi:Zn-dependent M28 family amino/carboxypeptidase
MADSSRSFRLFPFLRTLSGILVALFLLVCVLGIVVSGPIVVTPPPLETGAEVSAERLERDVRELCGRFAPRDAAHPENLDRAADWIAGELESAGLEVSSQPYEIEGETYRNVIGVQRGSETDLPVLVVGAHYDAFGPYPGADDNASGVALMLELARTLPQSCARADRYFVAFSTEEPPHFRTDHMGSHFFVEALIARDVDVDLMLSLDMVGYFDAEPGSQRFPFAGLGLLYPDRGTFLAAVGDLGAGRAIKRVKQGMLAVGGMPVHSFRAPPSLAPVDLSDHLPFRRHGLPAVQITDTSFMRNPHYHEATDTPETLDYERMARAAAALHGVLWDPAAPERCR